MLLILIVVLVIVATVALIVTLQTRYSLREAKTPKNLNGEGLRPLFAPDDAELRALERKELQAVENRDLEAARIEAEKRLASFNEFRQTWRESATRASTIELLRRAAEIERADVYLETVNGVLHDPARGFSDEDLAQLIESHFWLLPAHERTPGVAYTIKRELAALRGGSKAGSEEADHKS